MAIGTGIYQPQNTNYVQAGARSADALLKPVTTTFNEYNKVQAIDKEKENKRIVEYTLSELRNPESTMFAGKSQAEKFALVAEKLRLIAPEISAKYDLMAKEQKLYDRDESRFTQEQTLKKELNEADNKSREDIALQNRLAKASESGSASDIEQIWKDANRVLAEAIRVGDTTTADKYKVIVDRAESLLATKRPELWGDQKPKDDKVDGKEVPDVKETTIDDSAIKNRIKTASDGKEIDGVIDDIDQIKDEIMQWAKDNKVRLDSEQFKQLGVLLKGREETIAKKFGAKVDANQRSKDDVRDITTLEKDYKAPYNAAMRLKTSPTDPTSKRQVLNLNLRDETGAVIGADEFEGMMSTVLPAGAYADFKRETNSLGATLLGFADKDLKERHLRGLVEKYLQFVDADKLIQYTTDKIPTRYLDYRTTTGKGKDKGKEDKKTEVKQIGGWGK